MAALVETVDVDGTTVRLRTLAPAGRTRDTLAPTLVLLHGLGGSHRSLRRLQAMLSRLHRTVAIDLPGFAGVPDTPRQRRLHELAEVVEIALRDRDVVECVPIGHGFGAQLAVEVAHRSPDFATSVGMLAPIVDDRRRRAHQQLADLIRDQRREPIATRVSVASQIARNLTATLPLIPGALRHPMFKRVAELEVPVLLVRGHDDPLCAHDWARRLVGVAREGALIELPGAHHVHEHLAGPVAAIVDEFIRVQTIGRLQ